MERRQSGAPRPRPLDHGDPRTPMAWQHRNINYQQRNFYDERFGHAYMGTDGTPATTRTDPYAEEVAMEGMARNQQYQPRSRPRARPTSSSTETSATSYSTAEPDTDSQMKFNTTLPFQPDLIPGTRPALGTSRSMQSTLSTWDGEPCPVHHVPAPVLLPPLPPPQYSLLALPPPPPMLLPPMLRPRPLVLSAENTAPPEPLPVRDPKSSVSPLPPKERKKTSTHCCKGHIIVLWIVSSIIFVGVLLGVVLRFVIA
ncbi:pollen-specific leucine-rich repeat extensin-like protein 3 isoform X2 [Zootermopsis nevadensis]|uniref:pollen-specific leucine-rich repeat extensin-like protein 3 isoform X2 n=1 Tax=Zootermopsis nevadensis TaxID=136037 RepID=UPI000B8E7730|nr:pollen-specific leucine-rich repeat extensin-like protein 3 isoform X2 [Zootermopsis nevadensis]